MGEPPIFRLSDSAVSIFFDDPWFAARIAPKLSEVEKTLARAVKTTDEAIGPAAETIIARPAKRLRPLLGILGAAAAGIEAGAAVIRAAAAAELLHLASILHDDVIDEAILRSGSPTANVRFGNVSAVLLGDFFFAHALRAAAALGAACLRRFLSVSEALVRGEFGQASHAGRLPSEGEYLRWIEGKTARLFSLAASVGRFELGCGNKTFWACLAEYGRAFGIAYQIRDDHLDLRLDLHDLGKSCFNDPAHGIYTFPLIAACRRQPSFLDTLQEPKPDSVDWRLEVLSVLKKTDAFEITEKASRYWAEQAKSHLAGLPDGPARAALASLAEWVAGPVCGKADGACDTTCRGRGAE